MSALSRSITIRYLQVTGPQRASPGRSTQLSSRAGPHTISRSAWESLFINWRAKAGETVTALGWEVSTILARLVTTHPKRCRVRIRQASQATSRNTWTLRGYFLNDESTLVQSRPSGRVAGLRL